MWQYRKGLESLKTYSVDEWDWRIKLDANESCANLPPLVLERVINNLAFLPFNRYPDIGMKGLRNLIAGRFGLTADNVAIGNGSSEILLALCYAFGGPERTIVYPYPSFSMYQIYAQITDSNAAVVRLSDDYSLSRENILTAAKEHQASLILLCNPNNPTGTVVSSEDIEYIVANAECPVVVDEAYYEFYGESAVNLLNKYPNLIVTRTFSKAYSLAAARVGYMLADAELVRTVNKVMMPYHVNALSLAAAEIVFQMQDEFSGLIGQIRFERENMAQELAKLDKVTVYPSSTNFILFKVDDSRSLTQYLAELGISVKDFGSADGLENCIRATVGTVSENLELISAIKKYLEERC